MSSRPSLARADSSEQLEASFERIDTTSSSPDYSLSSEEETAVDEELLQSAKVDLVVVAPPLKKDSGIDEAVVVEAPLKKATKKDSGVGIVDAPPKKALNRGVDLAALQALAAARQQSLANDAVVDKKLQKAPKKDSGVVLDIQKGDVVFSAPKKESSVEGEAVKAQKKLSKVFVKELGIDLVVKKKNIFTQPTQTATLEELLASLEARLVSVIGANHQATMNRIGELEKRLEKKMNGMEEKVMHATDKIHVELVALEKESRESSESMLVILRTEVAQLKQQAVTEKMEKPEGEKKEKCSTARACEAAKKNAIDCLDKIKSKCKKQFGKTSSVAEDAVSVAAEAQADVVDEKEEKEDKNLETIVLTKPVIKLAFREGSRGAKCWIVDEVIHDTPYRLMKGDEIVTIDGVDATSLPHSRISKMMGSFPKKCVVGIRRCGGVDKKGKTAVNVEDKKTNEVEEAGPSQPIPIPALVQ